MNQMAINMTSKKIYKLYVELSEAIIQAEKLDKDKTPSKESWLKVANLEFKLSQEIPVTEAEGRLARRGAVNAALTANDYDLAKRFAGIYLNEQGTDEHTVREINRSLRDYEIRT